MQKDIIAEQIETTPNILIVDDDKNFRKSTAGILQKHKYNVRHFESAQDAILDAERNFFHLALIDYNLKDVHGLVLGEKLKAMNPYTGLILITGYASLDTAIESIKKGMDYFLTKPVDPNTLILAVAQVITKQRLLMERKKLIDDLREADRIKSSFISRISHEFNTPLTSIIANTAFLREVLDMKTFTEKIDKVKCAVGSLEAEARTLKGMIKNIIDASKIEAGKFILQKKDNEDVEKVISQAVQASAEEFKQKNISLEKELDLNNLQMTLDPERIRQLVEMLLKNAIKYSDSGSRVTLRAFVSEKKLFIEVEDFGPGIKEGESPFGLFKVYDNINEPACGGMGLSLSIGRAIVIEHGGTIEAVNKKEGKGCKLTVALPVR